MKETAKFLLVDTKVLPEVFTKVVYAKKMLAQGKAANLSDAAKLAGISRSALYKYKDYVHNYDENISENILTLTASLEDRPGVLSSLMGELYRHQCNILTVNQNIPTDGVAPVSISFRMDHTVCSEDELTLSLKQMPGLVDLRMIHSR